jgi:hypothetical protein
MKLHLEQLNRVRKRQAAERAEAALCRPVVALPTEPAANESQPVAGAVDDAASVVLAPEVEVWVAYRRQLLREIEEGDGMLSDAPNAAVRSRHPARS